MLYYIILLCFIHCSAMIPDTDLFVVDPQQKVIKLTDAKKKAFQQCQMVSSQQEKTGPVIVSFSKLNHSFLSNNRIRDLIRSIRDPAAIATFKNKTLFPLLRAADYLDAPESIRKKIGQETLSRLKNKELNDKEKEIKRYAQYNCHACLSSMLEKYFPEYIYTDNCEAISYETAIELYTLSNEQIKRAIQKDEKKIYQIKSLAFPIYKKIKNLVLAKQEIEDFCLSEIITSMPELSYLNLQKNKITQLTARQLDNMPTTNFHLTLSGNPIVNIDTAYFTYARYKNCVNCHINVKKIPLTRQQLDTIFSKNRTFCFRALRAQLQGHWPTIAVVLVGFINYNLACTLIKVPKEFTISYEFNNQSYITYEKATISSRSISIMVGFVTGILSAIVAQIFCRFSKEPSHMTVHTTDHKYQIPHCINH